MKDTVHLRRTFRKKDLRRGVLTAEFAVTFPIIMLLFATLIYLIQGFVISNSAEKAAYEAARRGIISGSTVGEMEAIVAQNMAIAMAPVYEPIVDRTGDFVVVTVRAPMDGNAWMFGWCPADVVLEKTCRLRKQ